MSESEYKVGNLYKITRSLTVWNTPASWGVGSDGVCGSLMVGDIVLVLEVMPPAVYGDNVLHIIRLDGMIGWTSNFYGNCVI